MDMILNRCPFCGSKNVTFIPLYEEDDQLKEIGGKIQCGSCLATFTHPEATSREDLIEYWNTRENDNFFLTDVDHSNHGLNLEELVQAMEDETGQTKEQIFFGIKNDIDEMMKERE